MDLRTARGDTIVGTKLGLTSVAKPRQMGPNRRSGGPPGSSGGECSPPALLEAMPRIDTGGACPACALSRWLRVVAQLEDRGWRTVGAELADYGEVPFLSPPATKALADDRQRAGREKIP